MRIHPNVADAHVVQLILLIVNRGNPGRKPANFK